MGATQHWPSISGPRINAGVKRKERVTTVIVKRRLIYEIPERRMAFEESPVALGTDEDPIV